MSTKKKITIAISSGVLVLLAIVVAVVAIIAAQQITISSQISVNYINKNVYGRASASYAVKYADQEDFEEFETFVYLDTEEPDNNQDDTVEVTLEEGDIIQFKFDFTNADPNDVPYVATLTLPTIKNFKVTIYNGTKDLTCSNIYVTFLNVFVESFYFFCYFFTNQIFYWLSVFN